MAFRIAFLGDIVGRPGWLAVRQAMPVLRERHRAQLVIANAENAAAGSGLTSTLYDKLSRGGVDGMTLGDHVFRKQEILATLEKAPNLIRPANLPARAVGKSWMRLSAPEPGLPNVYVFTVLGRLFMNMPADDPFAAIDRVLAELPEANPLVIVELHAEATSEKQALGWYCNGRVTAVVGTHTHVPTADARILPPVYSPRTRQSGTPLRTTAFTCDLGMCGPHESVIGRGVQPVLEHMTTSMHAPFDVPEGDPRVNGVIIEVDPASRSALSIERLEFVADITKPPFVAG